MASLTSYSLKSNTGVPVSATLTFLSAAFEDAAVALTISVPVATTSLIDILKACTPPATIPKVNGIPLASALLAPAGNILFGNDGKAGGLNFGNTPIVPVVAGSVVRIGV